MEPRDAEPRVETTCLGNIRLVKGGLNSIKIGFGRPERDYFFRPSSSDEIALYQIFECGEYDLSKLHRFKDILDAYQALVDAGKTPLIIDAGANVGAATAYFGMRMSEARIIAIEPDADNYKILSLNARGLNSRCLQAALGAHAGHVKIVDPGSGHWSLQTERAEEGIPIVSINQIFEEELSETVRPFLVKIDVEGFEDEVFSANTEWIDATPILAVELHDWLLHCQGKSKNFLKTIAPKDRDFVFRGETVFSLRHQL